MARSSSKGAWVELIRAVNTPLSYYVLSLLIVEATLTIVLAKVELDPTLRWVLSLSMIVFMAANLLIVAVLNFRNPKNLLYGKDEHHSPQVEPSALRDQLIDLIEERIKPECLQNATRRLPKDP